MKRSFAAEGARANVFARNGLAQLHCNLVLRCRRPQVRMFSRANQTRRDRRKRATFSAAKPRLKTAQGASPGILSPKRHALKVRFNKKKVGAAPRPSRPGIS